MVMDVFDAIKRISRTVQGRRAEQKCPLGCFLIVGFPETDKAFLARSVAESVYGDPGSVVCLDMSEFAEKHQIGLLVGLPPGMFFATNPRECEGTAGLLTEPIRCRPDTVVLLDGIEMAHPDVQTLLIHIMDEGILLDRFGRAVSYEATTIIVTSDELEIERVSRPEFLGRIDDILVFPGMGMIGEA
jgi:ATP-dependent Clp protease ATP-binding subunit ClpC